MNFLELFEDFACNSRGLLFHDFSKTHLENLEGTCSPLWTKKTLWHFIWSFLMAYPSVVMWLHTEPTCIGPGSHHESFPIVSPGMRVSVNMKHDRKHEGRRVSTLRSAQVIISAASESIHLICVVHCGCRSRSACNLTHRATVRQVLG